MTTGWNLCIADKSDEFARIRSMRSSQAISTIVAPQPTAQALALPAPGVPSDYNAAAELRRLHSDYETLCCKLQTLEATQAQAQDALKKTGVIAENEILHAENESLRASFDTLRTGYDAAQLEIASLQAQIEAVGAGGVGPLRAALAAPAQAVPEIDIYVWPVPDKCDRIVWRGAYHHLPIQNAAPAPARCKSCGTHEVSQQQTCHNSGCADYAQDVTIYEGWKSHTPASSDPVAVPAGMPEPAAWAETSEDGNVEALGMNQSRRFDTPLFTAAQVQAMDRVPPGWQAVPVEATREMIDAMIPMDESGYAAMYQAALATAPKPPAPSAQALDAWGGERWLTVVYRDVAAGDEARQICEHPKASAMSWSHALNDRDAAIAAQQGEKK